MSLRTGCGLNSSPCLQGEVAAERSEDDGGGLEPNSQIRPPSPSFHSGTPSAFAKASADETYKQGGEFAAASPSPGSQEKVAEQSEDG